MDSRLALRAGGVQALAVGLLFAVLVVLPLPEDFFRRYGEVTGPVAWISCAVITGRLLDLRLRPVLGVAAGSGAGAALVGVGIDHTLGLAVGIALFGAGCGLVARGGT